MYVCMHAYVHVYVYIYIYEIWDDIIDIDIHTECMKRGMELMFQRKLPNPFGAQNRVPHSTVDNPYTIAMEESTLKMSGCWPCFPLSQRPLYGCNSHTFRHMFKNNNCLFDNHITSERLSKPTDGSWVANSSGSGWHSGNDTTWKWPQLAEFSWNNLGDSSCGNFDGI